jgi:signal peptidase I
MLPTLHPGDRVLIDKLIYQSKQPKRGDIVLFSATETLRKQNFNGAFIERVIGLPGEKVEVKNKKVFINNRPLEENYIAAPPEYNWGAEVVPPDSYFVLGDNRNNSYDSHYWGYVPRALIIGKAVAIYCPAKRQALLDPSESLSPTVQTVLSLLQEMTANYSPNCSNIRIAYSTLARDSWHSLPQSFGFCTSAIARNIFQEALFSESSSICLNRKSTSLHQ